MEKSKLTSCAKTNESLPDLLLLGTCTSTQITSKAAEALSLKFPSLLTLGQSETSVSYLAAHLPTPPSLLAVLCAQSRTWVVAYDS